VGTVNTSRRPGAGAVTVDDDGMAAYVRIYPPGPMAPELTPADVLTALENAGVTTGIDEEALAELPLDQTITRKIATGVEPEDGVDGELVFLVEQTVSVRPLEREDGGVDMWAEATIPNVEAGEPLAEVHARDEAAADAAAQAVLAAYELGDEPPEGRPIVLDVVP
jgi:uncharacterized protein (DUF342 family)